MKFMLYGVLLKLCIQYVFLRIFDLLDLFEKRIVAMQRILFSGSNVDVAVRLGAILGRPTGAAIPTRYFGHVLTKKHDVFVV